MDYRYSSVIDSSLYDNEGLSDGIELRHSNYTTFEDRGAIRAQQDWAKHIAPLSHFKGTLAPRWSFMSVSVPECIPERLEIISYANEFAFLHDDATEVIAENYGSEENDEMMNLFLNSARQYGENIECDALKAKGKAKMQAQLMLDMLAIDRECALVTMKAWAKFVEVGSSRQHSKVFDSLEEYLPYRVMDVGEMFWYGVVTFGLGLHIPESEMEICQTLMKPAWIAVALANDVFSWPKERDAANQLGHAHVVNAIWITIQQHSVTPEEAEARCRKLSKLYVAEYLDNVKKAKEDHSISMDLRKYIEAMQYSISGNIIWSKTCPRYNQIQEFNPKQLEWMAQGVSETEDHIRDTSDSQHSRKDSAPEGRSSSHGYTSISSASTPITPCEPLAGKNDPMLFDLLKNCDLTPLSTQLIQAPLDYVQSLPSKGARSVFIDGLNHWLQLSESNVTSLKEVIGTLHNASLMLDDIQDNSRLRRGNSSTHYVFGEAQTINSAMFFVNKCVQDIYVLAGSSGVTTVLDKLSTLFVGQGQDLHSSRNLACPSVVEYIQTIDSKTGALFELTTQLMLLLTTSLKKTESLSRISKLIGRHFQIRDDYLNLSSIEYATQKGFCEDLNGGKYTLPLIYLLQTDAHDPLLQNLLSMRLYQGCLDHEQKSILLDRIKRSKGLEYTRGALMVLQQEVAAELDRLANVFGKPNPQMQRLLQLLWV